MQKLKMTVLLCVAAIGLGVFADPLPDDNNYTETVGGYTWTFTIENGEATIGVMDGSGNPQWQRAVNPNPQGALTIPATLGGCPVSEIGYAALNNCSGMTSVEIPDSVTTIGDNAFAYCEKMRSVVIPASVTNLGYYVFTGKAMNIWFKGNRPDTSGNVFSGLYKCCSYVRSQDTSGWDLSSGIWNGFPIKEWTIYPQIGWNVSFGLGEYGAHTGGGELEQLVVDGGAAVAPAVQPNSGYAFARWDHAFDKVKGTLDVRALYTRDGQPVGWFDCDGAGMADLNDTEWTVENGVLCSRTLTFSSECGDSDSLEFTFTRRGTLTFEYCAERSDGVSMGANAWPDQDELRISIRNGAEPQGVVWKSASVDVANGYLSLNVDAYGDCQSGQAVDCRLKLRNFRWTDAPERVTITLDPVLGSVSPVTITLPTDGTFGNALPIPVRAGCEFYGWSYEDYEDRGDGRYVNPDSQVPVRDCSLYAMWGVPWKLVVDPECAFSEIKINETLMGPEGDDGWWMEGLEFYYQLEHLIAPGPHMRTWYERISFWRMPLEIGSTDEIFSMIAHGPGVLTLEDWSGDETVKVDDVEVPRKSISSFESQAAILGGGDHRISFWATGSSMFEDAEPFGGFTIGAMHWTPAPETVQVTFDLAGGTADFSTRTYRTDGTYGTLPTIAARPGFEFKGWFTAPDGGQEVTAASAVDFTATTLYAIFETSLGTALNNTELSFVSSTWKGLSGVTHDGVAAACAGGLDWLQTNALSTAVSGSGTLSFWWRTDAGDAPADAQLELIVDGKVRRLRGKRFGLYGPKANVTDEWRQFSLVLEGSGPHTVVWSAYVEYDMWYGSEIPSLRAFCARMPNAWVDQVVWASQKTADAVKWLDSSLQAQRMLPGSADAMIAACDTRLAADSQDYGACVLRALAQVKNLAESRELRSLIARYGCRFDDDLEAFVGKFDASGAPGSNEAVDQSADAALPLLEGILADLEKVPSGWSGCVALSPEAYPVDEPVFVDFADVTLAKAFANVAIAIVGVLEGYDVSLDNGKIGGELQARRDHTLTVEQVLKDHPDFCTRIRDGEALAAAKEHVRLALGLADEFDAALTHRSGQLHFFEYDSDYADLRVLILKHIELAKKSLDAVMQVDIGEIAEFAKTHCHGKRRESPKTGDVESEIVDVTLAPFFGGRVVREQEKFDGNLPVLDETFDPTVKGVMPGMTRERIAGWLERCGYKVDFVPGGGSETLPPLHDDKATTIDPKKEKAPFADAAATYDGILIEVDGNRIVGTVQAKVAKMKGDSAKVTASVLFAGNSKKVSFKGGTASAAGAVTAMEKDGHTLVLKLGVNGFGGDMDGGKYMIEGSRNLFAAKKDADAAAAAAAALENVKGVVAVAAPDGENGWMPFTLTVANKGKVKVSGILADGKGTKVSVTTQVLVGEKKNCIPVVLTKKSELAFSVWFDNAAKTFEVVGFGGKAVVGRTGDGVGNVKDGSAFRLSVKDIPGALAENLIIASKEKGGVAALPDGVPVAVDAQKGKWTLPKAGKVALMKGAKEIDETAFTAKNATAPNPSALKLSYKEKDGTFKGSFNLYHWVKEKPKKTALTVGGVAIGGMGYGSAYNKKAAVSMPVTVGK